MKHLASAEEGALHVFLVLASNVAATFDSAMSCTMIAGLSE